MRQKLILTTGSIICLFGVAFAGANTIDVNAGAAMNGTNFGLEITPDGTNTKAYVQSDHPEQETTFNVEFYMNPNNVGLEHNKLLDFFRGFSSEPNNHLRFHLQWKSNKSNYKVWVWARENDAVGGKFRFVGKITLVPSTENLIRVEWAAGNGNGSAALYKNGGLKSSVSNLTNDQHDVEYIRLGLPKGSLGACPVGGCTGSFAIDEYVSTR